MNVESPYFLKISGYIAPGKEKEFRQTVQFIFNHLPEKCRSHHLSEDVLLRNFYHFYLLWESESALLTFRSSNEFELLKGSFQTLGSFKETLVGKWSDTQLFEIVS